MSYWELMMRRWILFSSLMLLFGSLPAVAQQCCDGAPNGPYVSVIGRAELKLAPDYVDFHFGITSEGEDLSTVRGQNQKVIESVIAGLRASGIEDRDVQTTQLSINRTAERDQYRNVVRYTGFELQRSVTVRLRDFSLSESIVAMAVAAGANDVEQLALGSSETVERQAEVRLMAARAAREKADKLATELGAQLGLPQRIIEEGPDCDQTSYPAAIANFADMRAASPSPESSLMAGELTVRASVCVDFALQ